MLLEICDVETLMRMLVCVYQSVKVLDEEESADKQLRTSHGSRWTRTPSERLTESIRAEAARYRQIIDNAITADGIVRQRYTQHREGFELLSRSDVSICSKCHLSDLLPR